MSAPDPATLARLAESYAAADAHQKHCLAEVERLREESTTTETALGVANRAAREATQALLDYAANGGK